MYLILIFLTICAPQILCRKLPPFIKQCHLYDNNLSSCMRENIEIMRPYFVKGIPEFTIPPTEPLKLAKVSVDVSNFHADLINISVGGATNFQLKEVQIDVPRRYFRLVSFIPIIFLSGRYVIEGRLMMFQLQSTGRFLANMSDLTAIAELEGYLEDRRGKQYLNFNRTSLKLKINTSSFYFGNLFPGNEELTESTNNIINENVEELAIEFMPLAEKIVSAFVINIIEGVFQLYSIDELFIME